MLVQIGERTAVGLQNGTCPQDCPIAHMVCPRSPAGQCSTKGRCYSNMGLCDCFVGCVTSVTVISMHRFSEFELRYQIISLAETRMHACRYAGAACDRCAAGYMSVGSNCVPVYPLLAQTGPAPAPAPMPHKVREYLMQLSNRSNKTLFIDNNAAIHSTARCCQGRCRISWRNADVERWLRKKSRIHSARVVCRTLPRLQWHRRRHTRPAQLRRIPCSPASAKQAPPRQPTAPPRPLRRSRSGRSPTRQLPGPPPRSRRSGRTSERCRPAPRPRPRLLRQWQRPLCQLLPMPRRCLRRPLLLRTRMQPLRLLCRPPR